MFLLQCKMTHQISSIRAQLGIVSQRLMTLSQATISRLLVELETGGNIRLEDGKPADVWYTSCADLVSSRFFSSDFAPFGIVDIRVMRVTRLHNRFLRNRFDERLESIIEPNDTSYKKSLEYLFFSDEQPSQGDTLRAAEEGFPLSGDSFAPVCLSNSVALADLPRVSSFLSNQGIPLTAAGVPSIPSTVPEIPSATILITKVCVLGRGGGLTSVRFTSHPQHLKRVMGALSQPQQIMTRKQMQCSAPKAWTASRSSGSCSTLFSYCQSISSSSSTSWSATEQMGSLLMALSLMTGVGVRWSAVCSAFRPP